MKVKDIIKKWQNEGVSEDIIRKRLLILRQQANPPADDTQDHELEAIETQTHISLPYIDAAAGQTVSPISKNVLVALFVLLGVNVLFSLILVFSVIKLSGNVGDLEEEVKKIKPEEK